MNENIPQILKDPNVQAALLQAWVDSSPGEHGGHEEGGFILRDANNEIEIIRWQKGEKNSIQLPPHSACKVNDKNIVGSFHTHPNTGPDHLQEPSETDRLAVKDDIDLKGAYYEGELVLSKENIDLIHPDGRVTAIGETQEILGIEKDRP